jgi:hypothetical protein
MANSITFYNNVHTFHTGLAVATPTVESTGYLGVSSALGAGVASTVYTSGAGIYI